jgi:hypothetical protein
MCVDHFESCGNVRTRKLWIEDTQLQLFGLVDIVQCNIFYACALAARFPDQAVRNAYVHGIGCVKHQTAV